MRDEIVSQVSRLTDYPELGRRGRVQGTRELVIARTPFVVPYRVNRNDIIVLRVLHGARRWPRRF
jgi:plasmid stabilization system protein ParE